MEKGNGMTIELIKQNTAQNEHGERVMLWKFRDENGNLWNTETAIDGTEEEAASIILGSMVSE